MININIVKGKWNGFNFLREINSCFGLIDEDSSVLSIIKRMNNIDTTRRACFHLAHWSFSNNHSNTHVVLVKLLIPFITEKIMLCIVVFS